MDMAEPQVPVEKIAAENDSFSLGIVDPSGNDVTLYDDLMDLSGGDLLEIFIDMELDEALSCGSLDDYLEIINNMELGELEMSALQTPLKAWHLYDTNWRSIFRYEYSSPRANPNSY